MLVRTPATMLFQPGWTMHVPSPEPDDDPVTGEPIAAPGRVIDGKGLLQQALWTGFTETTPTSVKDERMVLFAPPVEATPDAWFKAPDGHVWEAITETMPRGIPGQEPSYIAVQVRRAKEKEHDHGN